VSILGTDNVSASILPSGCAAQAQTVISKQKQMEKDTIIFVHGAWHGKWCWDKYFKPTFLSHGYQVITFNLPGHDKAGKIKGINKFSIGDYVKALEQEVQKLNALPIIIGHSMGGLIVQKFLEKNTCKKAVLMASVPPYGVIKTTLRFLRKPHAYPALLGLNLYGLVNSLEKSRDAFFSKELSNEELTEYADQLCSESYLAFLNMLLPRIKVNHHLKIPMLVIGAKDDKIFLEKEVEDTAKKYGVKPKIFDNIAHDMMLDINHEKVSKAIIDWIEKNPAEHRLAGRQ